MSLKRIDPDVITFGTNVRRIRDTYKWPARELARRADVAVSHIIAIENGEKDVGLSNALRISRALGVTIDGLTKGEITSVWLAPGGTGPETLVYISYVKAEAMTA